MEKAKAKKMKMVQFWNDENKVVPATPLEVSENDALFLDELNIGDHVSVVGTSKGKGFQGVVKRHGFGGGPKTHGQKDRLRAPGSIGATAPQRVIKGRKMAGHMGVERVTVKNLRVAKIEKEGRLVFLRGAVPGFTTASVEIKKMK